MEGCRPRGQGVTGPRMERAHSPGPDLVSQSLPLLTGLCQVPPGALGRPFLAWEPVDRPVLSPRPLSETSSLPASGRRVTKRGSRTAVLVRPPLPAARGRSRGAFQHPRWLRSRDSAGGGSPNPPSPQDSRQALGREPRPGLGARPLSWNPGGMGGGSGTLSLGFQGIVTDHAQVREPAALLGRYPPSFERGHGTLSRTVKACGRMEAWA